MANLMGSPLKWEITKCCFPYFMVAYFVCLSLAGCLPDDKPQRTDAVRVVIAGRTFDIPKGYFDGRAPMGKDTESVVLEYSLPGFEILPSHPEHRAERQALINQSRMKGMLLERSDSRPNFDTVVTLFIQTAHYKRMETKLFGLEEYFVSREGKDPMDQGDHMYVQRDISGLVQSYLLCDSPKKVKFSTCSQRFRNKGILFQISWPINELSQWQEQRDASIKFIDSLEVKFSGKE